MSSVTLAIFSLGATVLTVTIIKLKTKAREEAESYSTHNDDIDYEQIHLEHPTTHTHNINTSENVAYESIRIRL